MNNIRRDHSYGLILLKRETQNLYLVIENASRGGHYWSFPKGHPERGESPLETAMRETHEEVGVLVEEDGVIKDTPFTEQYFFQSKESVVKKLVTYFLAQVSGVTQATPDGREVVGAEWLSYEAAREKLTFENTKKLLDEVQSFVVKHGL